MSRVVAVSTRVIAALLAAILSWLGLGSQVEAQAMPESTAACAAFTCDGDTQAAATPRGATERGPPAAYDYIFINNSVDRWSCGTSARPDAIAVPTRTTPHNLTSTLAQVARARTATGTQVEVVDGDLSYLHGRRVAAKAVPETNKIYSSRALKRMADEPGPFHNFPGSFDETIFSQGTRTVNPNYFNKAKPNLGNDSIQYRLPGELNGRAGVYEIFTRPSLSGRTEMIMHRFFRPDY